MHEIDLSVKLQEIIDDLGEVTSYLWTRGWAERNGGNVSVNVTEHFAEKNLNFAQFTRQTMPITSSRLANTYFIVTCTGSRLRDLQNRARANILIVHIAEDLSGYHVLWGGSDKHNKPTSEFISHLKMHDLLLKNDHPQKAIVHTHPNHLIALTHIEKFQNEASIDKLLWAMHPEIKIVIPEGVGFTAYQYPGTEKLADVTIKSLQTHRVILWEKHGCIATGEDVFEAFDLIDTLNKGAEIFFICKNAGYNPQGLTDKQVAELENFFDIQAKNYA